MAANRPTQSTSAETARTGPERHPRRVPVDAISDTVVDRRGDIRTGVGPDDAGLGVPDPAFAETAGSSTRGRSAAARTALIAGDTVALGLGSLGALLVADADGRGGRQLGWALLWVPLLILLFAAYRLYARDGERLGHATLDDAPAAFHALLSGTLGLWALLQLTDAPNLTVAEAVTFLLLNLILVLLARAAVRWLLRVTHPERVLVVGTGPTELDDLDGVTLLGIDARRTTRPAVLVKRSMDVTVSALGLLLLLPLLPFVALAIKCDSPGPVFFVQDRMGRAGRHFRLWKLRTMVPDAEARAAELRARSAHAAWLVLDGDPRVTRLGRFLRLTSIDELPQLWNVLRGEMSLVGPRPMPLDTDRHIRGWARRRLDVNPGLTGPWQVLGRTALPFEEMLKLDYEYVMTWNLRKDLQILLRTAWVVVARHGAN